MPNNPSLQNPKRVFAIAFQEELTITEDSKTRGFFFLELIVKEKEPRKNKAT